MTPSRRLPLLLAALLLIALLIFFLQRPELPNPFQPGEALLPMGTKVGMYAPDFTLSTPQDQTIRLQDYKGRKAVLLNFWASWCGPCVEEMPLLQDEYESVKGDVEILAINLQETDIEGIVKFASILGVTYPILLDPEAKVKNLYGVFTQPVTFFIDKNGLIVDVKFGPLTPAEAREKIAKAITGGPP